MHPFRRLWFKKWRLLIRDLKLSQIIPIAFRISVDFLLIC
jgi:hypothetical protein